MRHFRNMNQSCHNMSHTHVTNMNESCRRTYGWVMSHAWMGHVIHTQVMAQSTFTLLAPIFAESDAACHAHASIMSHIWMSHITHMNEARHTYEWVTPHIGRSYVTRINESCHTHRSHCMVDVHVTHPYIRRVWCHPTSRRAHDGWRRWGGTCKNIQNTQKIHHKIKEPKWSLDSTKRALYHITRALWAFRRAHAHTLRRRVWTYSKYV